MSSLPSAHHGHRPNPACSFAGGIRDFYIGIDWNSQGRLGGHRSLISLIEPYTQRFGLGPGLRISMLANLGFDCLILEIWGGLAAGATITIPPWGTPSGPGELVDYLDRERISHAFIGTGSMERLLLSGLRPKSLASIVTAGEALRLWPDADFSAAVVNGYGPTEATVVVTMTDDLRGYSDKSVLPPIGRPIPGAEVWLESADSSVIEKPGVPGELIIGPTYLAHGYRNRPDLTDAAFITTPRGRTYRTGDTCQWNERGELEFLGRKDRQVKLTGVRVELAEIEQAILGDARRCPGCCNSKRSSQRTPRVCLDRGKHQ